MNTLRYKGNLGSGDTSRTPSPAIWADCPIRNIQERVQNGIFFYDDFSDLPLAGTQTTQIGYGKYKVFGTTGSGISRLSTFNSVEIPGGFAAAQLDTDNDSASLAQAYPSFMLSGLSSNSGKLWFECCYAQNSIATNMAGVFIGLAEVEQWTLATGVPFNGGDAITNAASAVGFRIEEDGLGVIDTVYSDRATSFTNVGDAATTLGSAYKFVKLGMKYDPADKEGKAIRFFKDNLELADSISLTTLQGLTNLDANALGLIWSTVADSAGTSFIGAMKWWSCAQVFDLGGGAYP